MSRNSLIVKAIGRDLALTQGWPEGFFESLAAAATDELKAAVDETPGGGEAGAARLEPNSLEG